MALVLILPFLKRLGQDIVAALFVGGTQVFVPIITTGTSTPMGIGLNVGLIDLSDFGIALGETIDRIVLSNAAVGSGADLLAVGALNSVSVPEPFTIFLLSMGLAGLAVIRKPWDQFHSVLDDLALGQKG